MLSEKSKEVIDFIEECRAQKMINDDLFQCSEKMYESLYEVEKLLTNIGKRELFLTLEELIFETITLTKDTYFEYGENFESVQMNSVINKVKKEAM